MPGFNGTGPDGQGPMSGRGMGRCNSGNPGRDKRAQKANRFGRGSGNGMGRCTGKGTMRSGGRGAGGRGR